MPPILAPSTTDPVVPWPPRWVRIPTVECPHVRFSRRLIEEAAGAVKGGDAIVLGAGKCQEIPLAALAGRFPRLTVNDHDSTLLDAALLGSGLAAGRVAEVSRLVADLTGVTDSFLEGVDAILGGSDALEAAVEGLARLANSVHPVPFSTGGRYDLVVASCVLCQLHLGAWHRAIARFEARFPGRGPLLKQSTAWTRAMFGLARRMEDAFVNSLHGLVAPGGRIYFSDTVQCAELVEDGGGGGWLTEGFLRMTRTPQLDDYLDDRFRIEQAARWHWVLNPADQQGRVGRLFRVQAFVMTTDVG